jgi:hypothetical protein
MRGHSYARTGAAKEDAAYLPRSFIAQVRPLLSAEQDTSFIEQMVLACELNVKQLEKALIPDIDFESRAQRFSGVDLVW